MLATEERAELWQDPLVALFCPGSPFLETAVVSTLPSLLLREKVLCPLCPCGLQPPGLKGCRHLASSVISVQISQPLKSSVSVSVNSPLLTSSMRSAFFLLWINSQQGDSELSRSFLGTRWSLAGLSLSLRLRLARCCQALAPRHPCRSPWPAVQPTVVGLCCDAMLAVLCGLQLWSPHFFQCP